MLKKTLKIIGYSVLGFALFIGFYFSMNFVLSRILVAKEAITTEDVTIFILTNGVHTDIAMPLKTGNIDWSEGIKINNTKGKDTSVQYLSVGWGDKGFYLETPTWNDLKFTTAFRAAFGLSTSALHTTFYKTLNENNNCKSMKISNLQYKRLVNYVMNSLDLDAQNQPIFIPTKAVYGENDAFYEAKGSYNMLHTCNTWANNGLKSCGQKASLWTVFDTGIFYHYR